jgi:uncharacterized membrane protein
MGKVKPMNDKYGILSLLIVVVNPLSVNGLVYCCSIIWNLFRWKYEIT